MKRVIDSGYITRAADCSHRYYKKYRIDDLPLKRSGIFCDITGRKCDEQYGLIPADCPLPSDWYEKLGVPK